MKEWINQSIDFGVKTITINGTFEPTTSPQLFDIIRFCESKDVHTTLVTNGTLLTYENMQELYDLGICILTKMNVPIVDSNNMNYEKFCKIQKVLTGRKEDEITIYEQQRKLISDLIKVGFNKLTTNGKTRLGIESIIAKNNTEYLPQLVTQLRELNIYSHVEVMKVQGFASENPNLQITKQEIKDLFQRILDNDIEGGYEKWQIKPPYVAGTCYQNLVRVDVKADGTISPCPGIELNMGNLNETSLGEILESEDLKIIRNLEQYIQGDCKKCELFKSRECYGGCRGTIFQTLAKLGFNKYECLVGSDPSCLRVKEVLDNNQVKSDIFK